MKMSRPVVTLVVVLTLMTLAGACAVKPTVWQKPNVQVNEQRAALAQCREYATIEAERDYQRQHSSTVGTGYGGQSTYQKNMDAYQVGKSRGELLARCMKLKGYRQVPSH